MTRTRPRNNRKGYQAISSTTTRDATLIDALLADEVIVPAEAERLRERLREDWHPAVTVIMEEGGIPEEDLLPALARHLGIPCEESLAGCVVPEGFFERVPPEYARREGVCATALTDERLELALAPGPDIGQIIGEMGGLFRVPVSCRLAPASEVEDCVDRSVRQRPEYLENAAGELTDEELAESVAQVERVTDFGELMRKAPVVKLVSLLIAQAVRTGSTDIHFQPMGDRLRVRFRTDGILHDILDLPRSARDGIMSRIKVLGKMDIAERRAPQDGRASFRYADREIDVRMSVVPTSDGERAVLRLLDKQEKLLTLEELGLDRENLATFKELIRYSHGMILVTGPTGSGKSTTLYASLMEINSPEMNIITIEDPVEYKLDGVSQIQVQARKNVTFGSMLRSIVRQDPDIIMIGEIRDGETASMAVQSSLTGHLMFSTLHTNDAAGAIARLLDLGVEPFLISSALLAVLAQRLVRRICPDCARPAEVSQGQLDLLGLTPEQAADATFRKGEGCDACLGTGYRGRIGIFELLPIDDQCQRLINRRASSSEIRQKVVADRVKVLREDGAQKAMAGVTTVEEVLRVTQRDSS